MIHAQNAHVRSAACAALGDFAKGVVVDFEETHWTGCLPGGGVDNRTLRTKAREVKPISAAGLLDESCVSQGAENPIRSPAHVIGDRQNKACSQLPKRRSRAGEGWRVRKERF